MDWDLHVRCQLYRTKRKLVEVTVAIFQILLSLISKISSRRMPMESRAQSQSQSPFGSSMAPLATIPDDLIAEILSRLQVKSLVRFKSVSRAWLSLISSHVFIKSHMAKSTNDQRLLKQRYQQEFQFSHCSIRSLLNANVTDEVDVDYLPFEPDDWISVVGCCDGLFCVSFWEIDLFLWNPSTRKFKDLPRFSDWVDQSVAIEWGFGYDVATDDYKVVGVVCLIDNDSDTEKMVMVYSIKTDTWRRIGDFPVGFAPNDSGKFVNGKLHWSLSEKDLIALDLTTEAYEWLEMPNFDRADDYNGWRLDIFEGSLCVLCRRVDNYADVWEMKEYGVKGSWRKLLKLPFNYFDQTLCINDKGENLWVGVGSNLTFCGTNKLSDVDAAFVFAESLVLPHRS